MADRPPLADRPLSRFLNEENDADKRAVKKITGRMKVRQGREGGGGGGYRNVDKIIELFPDRDGSCTIIIAVAVLRSQSNNGSLL